MGSSIGIAKPHRIMHTIPLELQKWEEIPKNFSKKSSNLLDNDIFSWNFNIWELKFNEMVQMSMIILNRFKIPEIFKIDPKAWSQLLFQINDLMSVYKNPYHNTTHVFDVMQSCSILSVEFVNSGYIDEFDNFCLLISALMHDLEHPGTNNQYQINAGTVLALRYNDISVLENHHCSKAFEIISIPECNVFLSLTNDQKKKARKTIISLILSTDMSVHFNLKDELDLVNKRILNDEGTAIKPNEKDVTIILKSLMHAADISNPAKPWELSKKWSDLVIEEFFLQGDREKKEGLPVSMNCDRDITFQDELSLNFTDFIVAPFFFSLNRLMPKLNYICRILGDNRDKWNLILMKRLDSGNDPDKIQESKTKWDSRASQFLTKLNSLEEEKSAHEA